MITAWALLCVQVVSRQSGEFSVKFWDVARSVLIFLGGPLVAGIALRYGEFRPSPAPACLLVSRPLPACVYAGGRLSGRMLQIRE